MRLSPFCNAACEVFKETLPAHRAGQRVKCSRKHLRRITLSMTNRLQLAQEFQCISMRWLRQTAAAQRVYLVVDSRREALSIHFEALLLVLQVVTAQGWLLLPKRLPPCLLPTDLLAVLARLDLLLACCSLSIAPWTRGLPTSHGGIRCLGGLRICQIQEATSTVQEQTKEVDLHEQIWWGLHVLHGFLRMFRRSISRSISTRPLHRSLWSISISTQPLRRCLSIEVSQRIKCHNL